MNKKTIASTKSTDLVIRFDGATADSGRLNLFQASESLQGATGLINLILHAFINKGEIRDRLGAPEGAKTYLSAAKKGCFEEIIEIEFGKNAVEKIKPSVIISNFWDYFACCVAAAVDKEYTPKTPMVRKISENTDAFFETMAARIETPLVLLHRPIKSKGASTITFERPHAGDVIALDIDTLVYVTASILSEDLINWTGNITKYNGISGVGRIYIDQFQRTAPFIIDQFEHNVISQKAAAASLNEWVNGETGKRKIVGRTITSSAGRVKRIIVQEITQIE